MKKLFSIAGAILIFTLFSCSKDSPVLPTTNEVQLNLLKVGQESKFALYTTDCTNFPDNLQFTGDTLVWKVSAKNDNSYTLQEYFTEGSPLSTSDTVSYDIESTSNYVLIPNRLNSNLLFFYGNDTIRTNPSSSLRLYQNECSFMDDSGVIFRGDDIAWIENTRFNNTVIENQYVISCVPIFFDLDAYILYNNGIVSSIHMVANSDLIDGRGWVSLKL